MPLANNPAAILSAPQSNSAYVQLVVSVTSADASGVAAACSETSCMTSRSRQLIGSKIDRAARVMRTIAASTRTNEFAYSLACYAVSTAGSPLTRSESRPVRGSHPGGHPEREICLLLCLEPEEFDPGGLRPTRQIGDS